MHNYKCLTNQKFYNGDYTLIPIRFEDRFEIMRWRNEQIFHLRQSEPLTKIKQDLYFTNIVSKLFKEEQPNQILFSLLKKDVLIGYGGLVHINWIDKNAEISFIMNTLLEKNQFSEIWSRYLELLELVAFKELGLRKIYVYAFDLRNHLYTMLEDNNYFLDAKLKDHCFVNEFFKDVIIYSKVHIK